MNQLKIDILIYKNVKIVGCEFSKYVQLLEGRQKRIRKYRQEDIKPLLSTATKKETEFSEAERLLRNSQYAHMKLVQVPNEDKWQIINTRINKVCHENSSQKVYETIKEITKVSENTSLNTDPSNETMSALMEIQKLLKATPECKVSVMRTDVNWCQIKEKGTNKVIYEGNAEETLIKLREMLTAQKRVEEIEKKLQPSELPSVAECQEIFKSMGYDIKL